MQAFTDLVGTSAVPALSINIDELTELTPALYTDPAVHATAAQSSEAKANETSHVGCTFLFWTCN